MKTPPYLKSGDQVRIISTARKISKEELQPAIDRLESWGFEVSFGDNLFNEFHQFAGTEKERAFDLQAAMDDENVKAILCARGGYGSVQLLEHLNFNKFQTKPKWLIGYSDVTVLHTHINQNYGIETLHATMPINFKPITESDPAADSLFRAISGQELNYSFEAEDHSVFNFDQIQGRVFGGNLSILYSLTGTDSQINQSDFFLFMEDLDEYLYHIDRMMMNLKRAGMFDHCKAVLVGGMTDMNDNTVPYGFTAKEIISNQLKALNVPVLFGVPAGHIEKNMALIMGRELKLKVLGKQVEMTFNGRT